MQGRKFDLLQVFRGLAALAVVIHHSSSSTNAYIETIPVWINSTFEHGFLGVDFFFVLSAFIIMSTHCDDVKTAAAFEVYAIKRFVRIFPPYWVVSALLLMGYFLFPSLSKGPGNYSLLSTLLLLPDGSPALNVAWTLIHEVLFYMIFSLFFIGTPILFLMIVSIWCLLIAGIAWLGAGTDLPAFFTLLVNPINLEFVLGMGVAYLARGISKRFAMMLLLLGCSIFVLLLLWPFALECRVLFGLPFSIMILGSVLLESQGKLVLPSVVVFIGDASYSIYLVHNPLISIVSRLTAQLHSVSNWKLGMFLCVTSSIGVGVIFHFVVEKPLVRLFRQELQRLQQWSQNLRYRRLV